MTYLSDLEREVLGEMKKRPINLVSSIATAIREPQDALPGSIRRLKGRGFCDVDPLGFWYITNAGIEALGKEKGMAGSTDADTEEGGP